MGSVSPKKGGCHVCLHHYVGRKDSEVTDERGEYHGYCSNNACPRAFLGKWRRGNIIDAELPAASKGSAVARPLSKEEVTHVKLEDKEEREVQKQPLWKRLETAVLRGLNFHDRLHIEGL